MRTGRAVTVCVARTIVIPSSFWISGWRRVVTVSAAWLEDPTLVLVMPLG